LFDPKEEGKLDPVFIAGGRVRVKDDTMTACLCLETDKPRNLPTGFDAPKGSGLVLLELKHTTPQDRKPLADPLRELLLKDGYTAVRMDRELDGKRRVIARTGQHDFRLLVDTGSSASMFDAAGLGKWGAKRLGATEGQAWRGKVKFEEVHLRGLTLGKFDTRSAWAVVYGGGLDLAELNKAAVAQKLKPIQGLLGNQDLLNGSAVMDFGTNTLYLRPVKETFGPQLEGKWVGVTWEYEGKKGRYKQGDSVVEFKGGRVRFADGAHEWGFHLQDEGDCYRLGLFEPKTDELAESFKYSSGGLLKLTGGTLTLLIPRGRVREEPTEFAAPKGSGLLLVDFERAK
jgi:hypothetical protein